MAAAAGSVDHAFTDCVKRCRTDVPEGDDKAFTACTKQCRDDMEERHRSAISYACIEAWATHQEGGRAGVMPTDRTRALGTTARRRRYHATDADIAIATAIVKRAAPKKKKKEVQCDMSFKEMEHVLTPGGSPSLSSVGSLSTSMGPGADVHRKASGSSLSTSMGPCDRTKHVLKTCVKGFDSEVRRSSTSLSTSVGPAGAVPYLHGQASDSSLGSSLLHQETIGAVPYLHGQASDSSLASSSSSLSNYYGNYYAANMQPMNGLNECRMNLEQCEQSQHSLFLLDGVLLLTLVSLSLVGVLCIICLCAVIIARYIPFNQRKSGHVTYQNTDTEIENL